ncbi:hypothetical protein D0T12_18520 [Actinomadura spongiicola]|uniref:Replication-relaxation n=1 Tax=Actinomadura spongiicola TaxID=2303421 RepID=A0A372GG35_9ACTN|nr:replication-relaxation family protein [Actinomadura spongiicola]RFS84152.1 hypothetical protein D0T12_18520 [Actinomadura spongiicola]
MTRESVADLLPHLSERDLAVLRSLSELRLLTTALLRRLHFTPERHATEAAAAVAAMRVLSRLKARGLVARLRRRIGGVRAGSSGIVWQLGATGERLLRVLHGEPKRRRFVEPSAVFVEHTLAVATAAVCVRELDRQGVVELVTLETEPACWRAFLAPHGARSWLKPDLFVITANGEFEDHWFIEVDRATEHPGTVLRKASVYQRYAATGAHQATYGVFPVVLWVVPCEQRQEVIAAALKDAKGVPRDLFRVITEEKFRDTITGKSSNEADSGT